MASMQTKVSDEDKIARDAFTRLAEEADEFEGYAHPHAERIAALSSELAKLFGLGQADRASLRLAALAHDLGEMAMKRDYIRRAAPLTFEERLDLARHPVIGEQEAARAGADRGAQLLVRWHQEWWNGAGYPDALARENIPLAARILRVADAYAALTDARPYRAALTEADARRHLTEWAGLEFDPQVVRAFLTLNNLPALRSYAHRDEDAAATTAAAASAATQTESPGDASSGNVDEWNVGGHVAERGTNPYVLRAAESAPGATLDSVQNSEREQGFDNNRDRDNFTKADTDRHA
ncbi:MAG TPA: HD domain-containing phosphohydrolase [Pyrinomonadaceae bacterium]|jgi:HD-GYP domain-containing protein (c-di-GMP phosphodiesterase class II)|nr:HD domain-containing phosphohydrolase [Pyrinomonadaceae bacterium]